MTLLTEATGVVRPDQGPDHGQSYDIVVIGAGPAGMAAAITAAAHGGKVCLLDEQSRAGGQIYRDVSVAGEHRTEILGADYAHGAGLVRALADSPVDHCTGATVWRIDRDGRVVFSVGGQARQIAGARLILATGALERPVPIPGWTLPGVMTAGAGQILLKQSGLIAEGAVLAGSGPLLYLLAVQMIRAGVPPAALVETQTRQDLVRSLRYFGGALKNWPALKKGQGMLAALRRAGVRRYQGARSLRVEGQGAAEALCFEAGGQMHRMKTTTVLLHQGVVPNIQASQSLGLEHRWDDRLQCFVPVVTLWGQSSCPTLFIAGDGAGIAGARAAEEAGRIAALGALWSLGRLTDRDRDRAAEGPRKALVREQAIRPFLETAYPPSPECLAPADSTVICRCEEVTAGDIRSYAALGCTGPNQTKAFGRSGMGPCQGRYCGLTVTRLLADATGQTPQSVGYYRIRPPLKPITLGELATLHTPSGQTPEQDASVASR